MKRPVDKLVLIVEDDTSIRQSVKMYLEDLDYDVLEAESAEKAIDLFEIHKIDAAIVDLRLPGMDGDTLIRKMHSKYPNTCFLIHTGSTEYFFNEDLKVFGMTKDHIIRKPVSDMNIFNDKLETLCGIKNG